MRKHLGSRTRHQARTLGEQLLALLPQPAAPTTPKARESRPDTLGGLPRLDLGYGLSAHVRDVMGTRKHRTDRRRLSVADQLRIAGGIQHAAALVEDAKRARPQPVDKLRRR